MKRFLLLFALIALCTTGKINAQWGEATCILPDKSQRIIKFYYDMASSSLKRVRIVCSDGDGKKSCVNTNYNKEVIDKVGPHFEGCEIIFPSTSNGYTITAVGHSAFVHCKAKITLPESVTDIEDMAFRYYEYDGYDFQLPSKVRYIGQFAFDYSTLKRIGLNANLKNIVDNAFSGCLGLEELVIPKGVYNIGTGITGGCSKLKRLEVESGNENYYTPAGSNVIMDTKQKTIIAGCSTSRIPDDTYRIGESAFSFAEFTNPTITIPESVGVIGREAFYFSNIKRLIIRGETVEIQAASFCNCKDLERIDIYGGNVTICESAFEGCTELFALWCYSHKPKLDLKLPSYLEGYPGYRHFYNIGSDWEWGNSNVLLIAKYPEEYTDKNDSGELVWKKWFATPIGYTDNYDYMRISEVHLTDFDWPVAGSPCDVTATSLTTYATVSEVSYSMFGKTYDPSKPAGYNEQINVAFTITLGTAPHGQCEFTDDVKLYVDGKEADYYVTASGNTPTQKKFVFTDYRVPAPPGGVPVRSVSITVPEPVEGQPLSTEVTRPTGKLYLAQGWTYSMVTWGSGADASTDSYDPTKAYTLAAIVTAKEDYCFAADCTFKLNGKEASVIRSHNTEGREVVMLAVAYGNEEPVKPDTTYITTLNLTVAEPVEGEVPVAEVLSPTSREMEAMGYSVSYAEWIEAGESWESFEAATEPYDPKQTYPLVIVLYADETTVFAQDMTVTINNLQPEAYLSTNSAGKRTATLVLQYSGNSGKRGDVNGDGSVNTADVVAVYSYIEKGDASGFDRNAADVNNDGSVNTADVVAIYSIIINGE